MVIVETVVCSAREGSDARLRRMLLARQEFKRRQEGCLGAWLGRGADNKDMLLVQSLFVDMVAWKAAGDAVKQHMDPADGGVEGLLLGPPLVGLFDVDASMLPLSISDEIN